MTQLIVHLIGDYLLQSSWMAYNKTKNSLAAFTHALVYSLPFLLLDPSLVAWSVICGTHFIIDRLALAKYIAYIKNYLSPPSQWLKWNDCSRTGYSNNTPDILAIWLLIITDNTIHLIINFLSLKYL
jgi:hypothetical protein